MSGKPAGSARDESVFDVVLGNTIEFAGVDEALGRQCGVGLKEWIRLQEGCDADIVVFDAATISDRSTFEKPMEPSVGVKYLVVVGTVVVDEGKIVPDVFPGRAILGPGKISSGKGHP